MNPRELLVRQLAELDQMASRLDHDGQVDTAELVEHVASVMEGVLSVMERASKARA